jgi:hypothetical protein
MKRVVNLGILLASLLVISGCGSGTESASPTPSPSATAVVVVSPTPVPIAVVDTKTIANKDGSTTVVTTFSDGSKREDRVFTGGEIARVRRSTSATGAKTAHVTYRKDNSEVEIKDASWVDKSMDATSDALVVAGKKTAEGAKMAGEKTAEGATVAGKKTAEGAKVAGEKTASAAKTAGEKTAEGAKVAGEKTASAAKTAGEKTAEGAKEVGKGAKKLGEKLKP